MKSFILYLLFQKIHDNSISHRNKIKIVYKKVMNYVLKYMNYVLMQKSSIHKQKKISHKTIYSNVHQLKILRNDH